MRVGFFALYEILIRTKWKFHCGFLDTVESYLSEVTDDWEKDIDRQALEIEDEDLRDGFYEFHSEDYHELLEYKAILLNSFFTTSYALFERQLTTICDFAKQRDGTPFSVRDFGTQNYPEKVKEYLEKLKVEFPKDTTEWQRVRIYQGIRNKIMHEGGYVKGSWNYYDAAKNMGTVSGDKEDVYSEQLKLTRPMCEEAAHTFERFLVMVRKAVAEL